MTWLYALQFAAPLILIVWLVRVPARSGVGLVVQILVSLAALAAMALQGIWLLPPWWAPFVFAILLVAAAGMGWRHVRPFSSELPVTWGAWIALIFFIALGTASTYGTVIALQSRIAPAAGVVNLAFPLEPGRYLIVNGGSNSSTNAHVETLNVEVPRYAAWRGQSYGVDVVALDGLGLRASGVQPADPRAYRIYGARVLAPCTGQVIVAVNGIPDMEVPKMDRNHMAGNHVLLRCAEADVLLGHLQPGSVKAQAGANVAVGTWLGLVGNSGNTGEPHLHIHAQGVGTAEAPLSGEPRHIRLNGRFVVRGDRIKAPAPAPAPAPTP